MPSLPKLSYVLLSHNREQYIRQALESAFAQDYEGELEYIISDDCSTDRTFDIIQDCVAAYKGGRRVAVTRTPRNLHLAGNTNHAIQFVDSDWIVRADDDDISSVDRCRIIGEAIRRHEGASFIATGICSFVDSEEAMAREKASCPYKGAVNYQIRDARTAQGTLGMFDFRRFSLKCWRKDVYETFGPLEQCAYYIDDLVCFLRACILGYGVYADIPHTVYVRQNCGNMSQGETDGSSGFCAIIRQEKFTEKYHAITAEPLEIELTKYRAYIDSQISPEHRDQFAKLLSQVESMVAERRLLAPYWKTTCMGRLRIRKKMGNKGLFSLLRCLPLPIFAAALSTYRYLFKR